MNRQLTARCSILLLCAFIVVYISIYNNSYVLNGHQLVKKVHVIYKDIFSCGHHNNSILSDKHIGFEETDYLEYQHSLAQKSAINKRKKQRTPEKIAEFNYTHFMTLANNSLTLKSGRLGNKMFQAASLIGVADWHGYTPVFTHNYYLVKIFELNVRTTRFTIGNMDYVKERGCCVQSDTFYNLDYSKNWTLTGFMQSWKYFMHTELMLRKEFTFRQRFKVPVMKHLNSLGRKEMVTVGVHVRRGNVEKDFFTNMGYVIAPVSYLQRAMQFFRDKLKQNVRFILVSNDRKWCKNNFNGTDIHISPFTDPVLDMALLSSCNHTIITTGTFGWWGAWLANGVTVYYAGFPRPGSRLENQFNKTDNYADYYPQHWIGMY